MAKTTAWKNSRCVDDGAKFVDYAKDAGFPVREGKGDHAIVYSKNKEDMMVVPTREIGKGLGCKIFKWAVAVGILSWIIFVFINNPEIVAEVIATATAIAQ